MDRVLNSDFLKWQLVPYAMNINLEMIANGSLLAFCSMEKGL